MEQKLLDVLRALSTWLDDEPHRKDCMFWYTIQSGPLEGNKISCTCGLNYLQAAVDRSIK